MFNGPNCSAALAVVPFPPGVVLWNLHVDISRVQVALHVHTHCPTVAPLANLVPSPFDPWSITDSSCSVPYPPLNFAH